MSPELAGLTWEEARDLDRARTVAVLPVGAVEAHGPHLPLGTDSVIAEAMARVGARGIESQGWRAVILPTLAYTAAPFGSDFCGTLSMTPATVTALILDVARALTRHGFAALAIANAHLDPAHLESLSAAAAGAESEKLIPVIFPSLARKPWALRLTEEFRTGACHAGRFEGSVVLAERPEWVRDGARLALEPNPRSLSVAIRDGARTFAEAGGARAYFGWPADATAAEGRETVDALGAILADAVAGALGRKEPA